MSILIMIMNIIILGTKYHYEYSLSLIMMPIRSPRINVTFRKETLILLIHLASKAHKSITSFVRELTLEVKVAKVLFYMFSCLCGVVIIGYLYLFIYYPYAYFPMKELYTIMYLNSLVEKILNIPYMDNSEEHQNNVGDLEHISYKEWFGMECEHPKTETDNYYVSFKAKQMNLHHEDLKLLHCLVPVFWGDKHPYPNKMPKRCTNIFNCSSIELTMYDYVLQYPKVLNNLIKIMEKTMFVYQRTSQYR